MVVLVLAAPNVQAEFSCAQDLNGNGDFTEIGETATCTTTTQGQLCPIGAVNCDIPKECPLDPALPCDATDQCSQEIIGEVPGTCVQDPALPTQPTWECLETGDRFFWPQQPSLGALICEQNCTIQDITTQTAACIDQAPICPLGNSYACMDNAGTFQCSSNTCSDAPPVSTPIDTSMLVDGGVRNTDGSCAAEINIFAGRPMECKTEGVESAFRNCCDEGDGTMKDDVSGTSNYALGVQSAAVIYEASVAAWAVYDAMIANSATAAAANAAAVDSFTAVLTASGPTILVAVAVAALVYYYSTACSQTDLETANMAASGFCHHIGNHCISTWLGGCVQRARVYCCFNSKIGRIIHEQGRPQLIPFATLADGYFGSVDNPVCRGFDQNELQAIDFSQVDLSEYFADITNAAQPMNVVPAMDTKINEKLDALP